MSVSAEQPQSLSPIKRALLALEDMQAKLDAVEYAYREPIAIIGMGCRFPGGASSPEAFWRLLRDGVDAITEVPKDRWDIDAYYDPDPDAPGKIYTRSGGFLEERVDTFNPQFFGISAREAKSLDPQQRLLLEVTWEAIENANQSPDRLLNSLTGVFLGICSNEYNKMIWDQGGSTQIDAFCATGNALSVAAGRLSYTLGLKGPNLAVDTACSSSLVATHLACQHLRQRECNLALVGGVHLLLAPDSSVAFAKTRTLDPDGRCKTFDATANGYVRGEGCGVLVLKRLSDALADGDNIQAVIRGSAVNHNGRSSSLVAPHGPSQQTLIRKALENAGVEPSQVGYVEVQGTGTSLGQPLEVEALSAVFGKNRPKDQPLMIGSVKTNIGHTEAASGVASLIKVILALQHGEIPPNLHFKQPNPYINWDELPVKVPTQRMPWATGEKRRLAGVNAFGFSGTNAHIILEAAPSGEDAKTRGRGDAGKQEDTGTQGHGETRGYRDTETKNFSASPRPPVSASYSRPLYLLALSAKTEESLVRIVEEYEKYLTANPDLSLADVCFTANTGRAHFQHRLCVSASSLVELNHKLSIFNTGQEAVGLIKGKATTNPKVAFLFTSSGAEYTGMGRQLYETQPTFRNILERCEKILRPYLEQPLLEILYPQPGKSSPLNEITYSLPALFALEYALFQLWKSWGVEPAVLIGDGVGEYVAACVAGVFNLEDGLKLVVQLGRFMEGKLESNLKEFEQIAKEVAYSQPQISLVSNLTGELATTEIATPSYWYRQLQQPVKLAASMEALQGQGYEVFLELGPKPVLLEMGRQSSSHNEGIWLASLDPRQEDWQKLLESLAALYVYGVKVDWLGFDRDYSRSHVQLPTYPWLRERYWIEQAENDSHKVEGLSQNNYQTAIVQLLNEGDTSNLIQKLQAAGKLSEQELKLLPKVVELLVNQNQQQLRQTSKVDVQIEPQKQPEPALVQPANTEPLTVDDIRAWLVRQIAKELGVKPQEIDIRAPFDSYGLDSMLALGIASAGQQFLGFEVSPLLLLHYPTIELLSQHLAKEFEASGSEMFEI